MSEPDRVRELLAFHAQGVLRGDDLAFVNQWLERNGADHPAMMAELAWLRSTAAQLQAQVEVQTPFEKQSSDAGLSALMKRIALEKGSHAQASSVIGAARHAQPDARAALHTEGGDKATWGSRTVGWLNEVVGIRSPALAFGVMAVVIGQAGVIGVMLADPPASQTPLSAAPSGMEVSQGQVLLTVAFRPQATELAIRKALADSSAQIVAGPGALGLYTLTVPGANADIMEAQLRAAVEVVESVQR